MKIAILTLRLHTNYGGILQAYALQKVLRDMGHDVITLQRSSHERHLSILMPLVYIKRLVMKCIGKYDRPILTEQNIRRHDDIVCKYTRKFITKYLRVKAVDSIKDINNLLLDAIVVGSDQIWRKPYFTGDWNTIMPNAFLKFAQKQQIKRIAYAASFGIDNIMAEYTPQEITECALNARLFDAISVREASGVEINRSMFGLNATHVVDPTLLLEKEDYVTLVNNADIPKSDGNLLCYFIDNSEFKNKIAEEVALKRNLRPFHWSVMYDVSSDLSNLRQQPPIEQWIRGFMDAEAVITDSFHACVFSYIFNKPFIVIGNAARGLTRIKSLLNLMNMTGNLILESDSISTERLLSLFNLLPKHNDSQLVAMKLQSLEFLTKALR